MLIPIIVTVVLILLILLFILGYIKASPDTAYIISGLRRKPKFLIGKAGVLIPFLEKKDELRLQLIPIDVKTSSAVPTADYINIKVDAAVNVKISDEPDKLLKAAQNFLNKKTDYIAQVAREVLEGNMREIVGQMRLEEMVCDRQKFAEKVKENADPDLARMGLDIVSFNVQNFVDDNQVIENLGVDNIVKIQKGAAIARAEAERDIAKARAEAERESNDAKVTSQTAIAERNNQLAIRTAELKKESDIKRAESDAAYKIQEEEQRKTVEVRTIEADIARQEQEVILNKKKAEVREQQLEAEIKKKADADLYSRQKSAEASQYELQRQAEARLFQIQKGADAEKYKAEQEAAAIKAKATAEAESIRLKGLADAEAVKAKAVAEAEGIEQKAIAMQKMNEAAILEMYFKAMPEIAKNIAEPLTKVDRITMYGDGNSSKLTGDIIKTLTQVSNGIQETAGVDLSQIINKFVSKENTTSNQNDTVNNNTVD
ncbi:MAG: flotillin family protein [Firmicutes bacterium]|nr:flotillin family protein [Bacillota bacterium]